MNEQKLNELFGLEPESTPAPAAGGTDEPEGAGAETVAPDSGTEDDDSPAGTAPGEAGADEGTEAPAGDAGDGAEDKSGSAPDEDTLKQIREAADAAARARMDEIIKSMNLVNPRTKERLQSYADWEAYNSQVQAEQRERAMKKLGMNEQEYREFIQNDPDVRAMSEAAKQAQNNAARVALDDQIRQLHELDPSINNVRDLGKMPNYPRFYELVKRNHLSLVDAYKLVNMDKLTQRNVEASRQAARNAEAAKAHLTKTAQRGSATGEVTVPKGVQEIYKGLDPSITQAEMQRDYSRYVANTRKGE